MRAALYDRGEVEIRDVPDPEPRVDEALVRLRAAGVCHSDLHLVKGDWSGIGTSGRLGHEGIGIVEELGPGAERFVQVGDRVIVGLGGSGGGFWCGACSYCLGGRPRLCRQAKGIMGTFAQRIRVYAKSLVVLPEGVSDLEAPLACGGLTAYGAVKKLPAFQVPVGGRVAIVGAAGGLGHYAVQLASHFGYKVVGVDVGPERVEFVRGLGAWLAVDAAEAAEAVKPFGGVHASLVFSPRLPGYTLGLDLLRPGGLFVGVGIPAEHEGTLALSPWKMFAKEPVITFSAVGTVQDMRELVELAAEGRVRTHVARTGPLSELSTILGELETAAYAGRAVITDLDR